jgi:hypothetical protein
VWGAATDLPEAGQLVGVSCVSVGNCAAVNSSFVVVESAGVLGAPTSPPSSPDGGGGQLLAVSCVSVGYCTAVGVGLNGLPLIAVESAGVWGTPIVPSGSPSEGQLAGVSCVAVGYCTAVGTSGSDYLNNDQPMAVVESAGVWGTPTVLSGEPGGAGDLLAVSCTSAVSCTAVGYDGNAYSGNPFPIVVADLAGAWGTPTQLPGSPGGTAQLQGVSCSSRGNCTAVGWGGTNQPMLVVAESAGVWGALTQLSGPPGDYAYLSG